MAPYPSLSRSIRGPRGATAGGTTTELLVGIVLLGAASAAGLAFVHRPWPNRLDVWGYRMLPSNTGAQWAHDLAALGSLPVLIAGVIGVFVVGLLRDWVRAFACAAAPLIAVLIVQDLAKPLVGRHLGMTGGSSYPSGTVAAVAALATAATLVVPMLVRPAAAVLGAVATVGACAAVVVLRWHYPTDALGGVAVGMGAVLTIDALFHLPWAVTGSLRTHRSGRRIESHRHPRMA